MYEFTSTADWAIQKALDLAQKCLNRTGLSITVLVKLLSATSRWDPTETYYTKGTAIVQIATSVITQSELARMSDGQSIVDDELSHLVDETTNGGRIAEMIVMLEAAGEHEMMCWVYFHVLVYCSTWKSASWLRTIDRHRLLCGHYELTRIGVSLLPPSVNTTCLEQIVQFQNRVLLHELWPLFDSSRWAIPEVPGGDTTE